MATYSIRDLEKISGIKAHTLRMWEQRFDILHPKRTDTNIRYYDEEDLRLILSIAMLNMRGFKISRIASMAPSDIHHACQGLQENIDEHEHMVAALTMSMVDMDEARFEKTLSACTLKFGFEETMTRVIHPFYERVGILWQTGTIRPAQEHFISNLIRQKLIVAIDAQQAPKHDNRPRFILFLPEHELHEIGLLYATLLLRQRGFRVVYLGQAVPEQDLPAVYESHPSAFLFTIITMTPPKESTDTYVQRIATYFPQATLLLTGYATQSIKRLPANVRRFNNPDDLLTFVTAIGQGN